MEILRENIEDHLEIRLDEVTDILLLVNSDRLLPNIEVSLMNSRDTILGQLDTCIAAAPPTQFGNEIYFFRTHFSS